MALTDQVAQTFFSSPAYVREQGRPVMMEFGMEVLPNAVDWSKVQAAHPEILWIHRNPGGFSQTQSSGGFAWWDSRTPDKLTPGYDSTSYLDYFYKVAAGYPKLLTYGSVFKGFNDSLASWSPAGGPRQIYQSCGQTWLKTFATLNQRYSAANPLHAMQLNTWNDYEEGSELESGIDNCVMVSAAVQNGVLSWSIQGQENTIHHYTVFVSTDGENLMRLGDFSPGTRNLNLESFGLAAGKYTLYVKATGQPLIRNQMSPGVAYTVTEAPDSISSSSAGSVTVSSSASDATFSEGNSSGENTSGENTSGGNASAQNTSGGNTSGGNVSGGNASTENQAVPASAAAQSQVVVNVGLSPSTLRMKRGGAGWAKISLQGGSSGSVTLACSNLPAGVRCSFSPETINLSARNRSAILIVSTDAPATAGLAPLGGRGLFALFTPGLGLLGVVVGGFSSRRKKLLTCAVLALVLLLMLSMIGCGGVTTGLTPQTAPAGNYHVKVSATSSSAGSPGTQGSAAIQGSALIQGSATATLVIE
jgi:hypothetical protein